MIDACERLGSKVQNSDDFAYDLLVNYARKFGISIVAFTCSRTELYSNARYEYDLYGPEMDLPIEGEHLLLGSGLPVDEDGWNAARTMFDAEYLPELVRSSRLLAFRELLVDGLSDA